MKSCTGTIYNIGGKDWCVGEKMTKKVNGKTVTIKATSKKGKISKKSKKGKKGKKIKQENFCSGNYSSNGFSSFSFSFSSNKSLV
jgi:hypothetical protein